MRETFTPSSERARRPQGRLATRSCGFWVSRARFNSNLVVHGLSQSLFAAEIFFRGLHRDVAQQKLTAKFDPSLNLSTSHRQGRMKVLAGVKIQRFGLSRPGTVRCRSMEIDQEKLD